MAVPGRSNARGHPEPGAPLLTASEQNSEGYVTNQAEEEFWGKGSLNVRISISAFHRQEQYSLGC